MNQGDWALVRAYGGQRNRLRVWGSAPGVVCSDENYQRLVRGVTGLWPVGIPARDVTPIVGTPADVLPRLRGKPQ
jgi:hypothetical protein